jgi:predicted RNase H-like nuclease (RuvC/YqgF family)
MKAEIDKLKSGTESNQSIMMLQKNVETMDKNMRFLNEQFEKGLKKEQFDELESSLYKIQSEHKIFQMKLQTVEDMLVNYRGECFNQINDLEKFFISKNENLKQAICHLCRNLKVTNPLT